MIALVIVISSHTHILVSFFLFSSFYKVGSLTRLVSVSWGLSFFFTPLFHLFLSFFFRISSNFDSNFTHYLILNS